MKTRSLIKIVTIESADGTEIPSFVNVRFEDKHGNPDRGYVPLSFAMTQESLRDQVLKGALLEIRNWQQKYKIYQDLSGVVNLDKVSEIEAEIGS